LSQAFSIENLDSVDLKTDLELAPVENGFSSQISRSEHDLRWAAALPSVFVHDSECS
jgi:hypothetical protein